MKFICLQENLKKGLAIVNHINNKNINLPILNNILIRANDNDNSIELISTNLEIGITHQLRGKIEEGGETTIDAKIISDYVNLLPEEKIEFKEDNNEINIKCENYKTKVKGESSKEYPLIPVINRNNFCEINIFDFRKALHVVEENNRVLKAVEFLDKGDSKAFGKLLLDSHYSSRFNFENSCAELDYLIELSQSIPGCVGARLSGGGFGGISIHLVADNEVENYLRRIQTAFKIKFGVLPETIICKAGDGAEWL